MVTAPFCLVNSAASASNDSVSDAAANTVTVPAGADVGVAVAQLAAIAITTAVRYLDIRAIERHDTEVFMAKPAATPKGAFVRVGKAAELLGVSADTLRRWEADGRLRSRRSRGGQRLLALPDVMRLAAAKRAKEAPRAISQSARNRFEGIVTRVEKDRVAAVVEVRSGPHRLVSLMTAEAAEDLKLRVGLPVACVVKATNVIVEVARGASTSV